MLRRPPSPSLFPSRRSSDLVGLVCVAAFILPRHGLAVFETGKLGAHTLRSVSQMFSQTFILLAFSLMPLADRKSTRLNSSHSSISYAVFCLKKKTNTRSTLL